MNDRERFAAAFGHLHASPGTLKEVQKRMNDTRQAPRRVLRRGLGLALAAALLLALGVTAYATGMFGMSIRPATEEELEPGSYMIRDREGNVDYEAGVQLPADGLTFTWDGEGPVYRAEFRTGWLPARPNHVYGEIAETGWDPEAWQRYLYCDWGPQALDGSLGIRYSISLHYARPDFRATLFGEYQTVEQETWGDLSVTKVEMLYNEMRGPENYVILFSEREGYMVVVGGSEELSVLEDIARGLEIRVTDEPVPEGSSGWGMLNIGRG